MLHFTLVWRLAAMDVTNCCVCETDRLTEAGLMAIPAAGLRVTMALADLAELATLVAVIVTA
jgi:hypothetical protein